MSQKETTLYELTRSWKVEVLLPELLAYVSPKFFNIKNKGSKSDWNQEAQTFVLTECMKEGVNLFFHKKLLENLKKKSQGHSTEQMLVAHPSNFEKLYPDFRMEYFGEDQMKDLLSIGHLTLFPFIGDFSKVDTAYEEFKFCERDGRFERNIKNSMEGKEKFMWTSFSKITEKDFPG